MEKQFIATWREAPGPVCATIIVIEYPPHSEPWGCVLQNLAIDAVAERQRLVERDAIEMFSVIPLPNHVWCQGRTAELCVGGRPASLEAGHSGWRIHI